MLLTSLKIFTNVVIGHQGLRDPLLELPPASRSSKPSKPIPFTSLQHYIDLATIQTHRLSIELAQVYRKDLESAKHETEEQNIKSHSNMYQKMYKSFIYHKSVTYVNSIKVCQVAALKVQSQRTQWSRIWKAYCLSKPIRLFATEISCYATSHL